MSITVALPFSFVIDAWSLSPYPKIVFKLSSIYVGKNKRSKSELEFNEEQPLLVEMQSPCLAVFQSEAESILLLDGCNYFYF